MSRRFQFSLKWLFVAMLVVAAFFGGMELQKMRDEPVYLVKSAMKPGNLYTETIQLRDGSRWHRDVFRPPAAMPYRVNPSDRSSGRFVTLSELSQHSGVSTATIKRLSRAGVIPQPAVRDDNDRRLFDLRDPKLAEWLSPVEEVSK